MTRADLKTLQSFHGYPALSLLIPTHRTSPENRQDPIRVKNLVREATDRLQREFSAREVGPMLERLHRLVEGIDYRYALDGLAIFVARDFAQVHLLPFPVVGRVVVDATFATRDLVRALNRSPRYRVLVLSEKTTRLYTGTAATLVEYNGSPFPMTEGEKGRTEAGHGNRTIEKSSYRDERHKHFFKQVDQALAAVLQKEPMPVIVTGGARPLAIYQDVAKQNGRFIGTLTGAYERTSLPDLGRLVWPLVESYLASRREEALREVDVAVKAKKCGVGIQRAWIAAHSGRGSLLVVEDGYYYPAKVDPTGQKLSPAANATSPGVVDDAVDEIIEQVLIKGGRVVFVPDGTLEKYKRIVVAMRF